MKNIVIIFSSFCIALISVQVDPYSIPDEEYKFWQYHLRENIAYGDGDAGGGSDPGGSDGGSGDSSSSPSSPYGGGVGAPPGTADSPSADQNGSGISPDDPNAGSTSGDFGPAIATTTTTTQTTVTTITFDPITGTVISVDITTAVDFDNITDMHATAVTTAMAAVAAHPTFDGFSIGSVVEVSLTGTVNGTVNQTGTGLNHDTPGSVINGNFSSGTDLNSDDDNVNN